MKTNCLFFALALYYRRLRKNRRGYIVFRRSFYGWFPHFMYSRRRRNGTCQIVGYVPCNPRIKRIPPPIFRGRVQWGDPHYGEISIMTQRNSKEYLGLTRLDWIALIILSGLIFGLMV